MSKASQIALVRALTATVYAARQSRAAHPEGTIDKGSRFYPSDREDGDDVTRTHRLPSRAWPWSYMLACRTRRHCKVLVERCLAGHDVPADVARVCFPMAVAA